MGAGGAAAAGRLRPRAGALPGWLGRKKQKEGQAQGAVRGAARASFSFSIFSVRVRCATSCYVIYLSIMLVSLSL